MREAVFSSPFFGITLSLAAYCIGVMICRRTSLAICNPLLISYLIIIPTLLLAGIPLEWYENGGDLIDMFLSPATAVLALTVYRQRKLVRRHIIAIAAGTVAGCVTSITTVYAMCRLLSLDGIVTRIAVTRRNRTVDCPRRDLHRNTRKHPRPAADQGLQDT